MPYDGSIREELAGYFEAKEPGRRERAENWAIAIGLQKVDGLTPSDYLVSVAKKHIEGKISDAKATDLVDGYYETKKGNGEPDEKDVLKKGCQKRLSEKGCQKTAEKLLALLKAQPQLTQAKMAEGLGISRQAVQKHLANLKASGRLRRIGPDRGGHWKVVSTI